MLGQPTSTNQFSIAFGSESLLVLNESIQCDTLQGEEKGQEKQMVDSRAVRGLLSREAGPAQSFPEPLSPGMCLGPILGSSWLRSRLIRHTPELPNCRAAGVVTSRPRTAVSTLDSCFGL